MSSYVGRECWKIRPPIVEIPITEEDIPNEILMGIFVLLSKNLLFKCAFVCRRWRHIVLLPEFLGSNTYLKLRYPQLTIIDEAFWESITCVKDHGLSFEGAPKLNWKDWDLILSRLFNQTFPFRESFFRKYPKKNPGIKNDEGATLITIPKGMTFQKMCELAGTDKSWNKPWWYDLGEIIEIADSAYTVLITNDVFKHTASMKHKETKNFLKGLKMTFPTALPLYCLNSIRNIKGFNTPATFYKAIGIKVYIPCKDGKKRFLFTFNGEKVDFYPRNPRWVGHATIGMISLT